MVLIVIMECGIMFTTIQIKRSTKELLDSIGKKSQTYDDIVFEAVTRMVEASK